MAEVRFAGVDLAADEGLAGRTDRFGGGPAEKDLSEGSTGRLGTGPAEGTWTGGELVLTEESLECTDRGETGPAEEAGAE